MPKKTIPVEKHEELKDFFVKELARRDEKIDQLKKENALVMKSALKQAEKNEQWAEYAEKLEKRILRNQIVAAARLLVDEQMCGCTLRMKVRLEEPYGNIITATRGTNNDRYKQDIAVLESLMAQRIKDAMSRDVGPGRQNIQEG